MRSSKPSATSSRKDTMLQLLVNGHLDCSRRRDAPEESNAGGVLSGSSSVQLSAAPRAVSFAKALHSDLCTERPTSTTPAPARVPPSRRKGDSSLTLGHIQDGESKGPHLPSRALGPPAQAQRPRAAANTRTVTEPTRPNAAVAVLSTTTLVRRPAEVTS